MVRVSVLVIKAYNDFANKCYRELFTGNEICIEGILETSGEIEIQEIMLQYFEII